MNAPTLPTAEAETKALIGSIILLGTGDETAELAEVIPLVRSKDIAQPHHATIYAAIEHLHRRGLPIDKLAIVDRLRSAGQYEQVGGAAVMAECGQSVPTTAHAKHYAGIVKQAARQREAYHLALSTADALRDGKPCDEVLCDLRAELDDFQRDNETGKESSEAIFDRWAKGITDREKSQFIECGPYGSTISKFPIGPEQVTIFGAPPAAGKTAYVGQIIFDALRMEGQEHLKVLIANVEMSASALLTRQAARFSSVSYSYLHHRDYDESARPRIELAIEELRTLTKRVEFMRPPFTLEHLRHRAESFEADIVVVDYAQRFTTESRISDARAMTNLTMDCCRHLADQGRAVIVVSALSRQKGPGGSTYENKTMGLASFRESSELEYGADTAWLLLRDPESDQVELKCVKNRTGSLTSLKLLFDGSRQSFRDDLQATEWKP